MHNWYNEELKPGDKLTFTEEVEMHFEALHVEHKFHYGDELVVVERDDRRDLGICVSDPRDLMWKAWISIIVAERAQEFWLEMNGVEPSKVSSPLPPDYWNKEFAVLTPGERIKKWEQMRDAEIAKHWEFLMKTPAKPTKK